MQFGDAVGIGDSVTLYSMDKIRIGDYAVISQGANVCTGSHDFNTSNFQLFSKPIIIGARAWICSEVFIHPGVSVAEGVVIGARSVVIKSVSEAWSVNSGNPCKKVGVRKSSI
ncbi:hypothetical protein [Polynucleobacter sp. P1-05-14]|uniref:hypothetical protein n=1 Tax=Polynucleobacter sp. P1-05-14 TaxID=1819732 RepID=UPI00351D6400